jgi:hypothetical protein
MLGRTFTMLEKCSHWHPKKVSADASLYNELQMDLPACRSFFWGGPWGADFSCLVTCPNVQSFRWEHYKCGGPLSNVASKSLHDSLLNAPCLQKLELGVSYYVGLESLIHFIFCDSLEQGVWKNIRSVRMKVGYESHEVNWQLYKQRYEKGWKEFKVDFDWVGFESANANLSAWM